MTTKSRHLAAIVPFLWIIFGSVCVVPAGIMVPPGVGPGGQFRIVFVTSTTTQATSSDIAYYDSIAAADATAAGLTTFDGAAVTWQAIASTPTVNAFDGGRLPIRFDNVGIYRIDGVEVASSTGDLWSTEFIHAAIDVNEKGQTENSWVWTGTNFNGSGDPDYQLGTQQSFPVDSLVGISSELSVAWTQYEPVNQNNMYPVYAVSSVLTVPIPPPPPPPPPAPPPVCEPSSLIGASTAVISGILTSMGRKRRRKDVA